MAGLHGIPVMQIRYNTGEYPFQELVHEALDYPSLSKLHQSLGRVALVTRETDQQTEPHRQFYANFDYLEPTYRKFIRRVVQPLFDEPIVFQKVPTFRTHLPGNLAVGEWHKDSDYSHSTEEIAFWLPITDAYGSNAVHVLLDGKPREMPVPYGHVLIFDSANLMHGNLINTTEDTRVSFDFRVIPESKFTPSDKESINTHLKMDVGGYYDRLS